MENKTELWSIGHSTHAIAEFVGALQSFDIKVVADVRSFPGSRRYPQFNKENLKASLAAAEVEYLHFPELGVAAQNLIHLVWPGATKTFRGYADNLETNGFRVGRARLISVATSRRTAIMCAGAVWWRCHRSLISDYLKAKSVQVTHIVGSGESQALLLRQPRES